MSAVKHDMQTLPRRRDFLGLAIVATACAGAAAAQTTAGGTCEAGDTNPGRASMRKALEYVSPSKTPGKACAGCAFYAATVPNCGKCQLLNNGPVSGAAVCGSWAPKK